MNSVQAKIFAVFFFENTISLTDDRVKLGSDIE